MLRLFDVLNRSGTVLHTTLLPSGNREMMQMMACMKRRHLRQQRTAVWLVTVKSNV
jgi:hypothetical protein